MTRKTVLGIAAGILLCAAPASARDHRVEQLPYGARFGCTSCHISAAGGGVFTGFGSDAINALVGGDLLQERDLDWSLIYHLDSDRDGFTNGEEVYDPNGTWRIGSPNPLGGVPFNPGDPQSHPFGSCGDGRVTPPEECDGTNFRDQTCIGLGLDEGVLTCRPDCTFDRSGCGGGPPPESLPDAGPDQTEPEDPQSSCATAGAADPAWLLIAMLAARRRRGRRA